MLSRAFFSSQPRGTRWEGEGEVECIYFNLLCACPAAAVYRPRACGRVLACSLACLRRFARAEALLPLNPFVDLSPASAAQRREAKSSGRQAGLITAGKNQKKS
jgi:hypothetical protein